MSAYVMNPKDLAIMARELVKFIDENRNYGCRPFDTYTKELDAIPAGTDKIEYTYKKLYALNQQSVNTRYSENNTEIPPMPTLFPTGGIIVRGDEMWSPVQLVKKIGCWKYQSCEDDEILYGTFYREMGEWAGRIALQIVKKSAAYEDAAWGL